MEKRQRTNWTQDCEGASESACESDALAVAAMSWWGNTSVRGPAVSAESRPSAENIVELHAVADAVTAVLSVSMASAASALRGTSRSARRPARPGSALG